MHAPSFVLELVDQPLEQPQALGPEAGIGGIEAEGREQLLVPQRAAGARAGRDSCGSKPSGASS